jgi:hypothetical protein
MKKMVTAVHHTIVLPLLPWHDHGISPPLFTRAHLNTRRCAGLTVVIVREDLLNRSMPVCPTILSWSVLAKAGSMHNTPPTWPIYISYLVFGWMEACGGVEGAEARSAEKSSAL